MKYIEKNHGHWQIKGLLKKILMECRAKETSRYAINGICVGENTFASTDGRRLVELQFNHKIPEGNYFCTSDGYLLDLEGNFPKYKDIIPKKKDLKRIVKVESQSVGENVIGLIIGELCHAGCVIKLSLYQRPITILSKVLSGTCEVYISKVEPESHPFIIEVETSIGHLRYVQMPVNVKNEA